MGCFHPHLLLVETCYGDSNVAIIAFALNDVGSLIHAQSDWLLEILQNLPGIPILLVGMKKDLVNEITDTTTIGDEYGRNKMCLKEQINTAKRIIKPVAYHTCSTFQHDGIEELFELVVQVGLNNKAKTFSNDFKSDMFENSMRLGEVFTSKIQLCSSDSETQIVLIRWKKYISEISYESKINADQNNINANHPLNPLDAFTSAVGKTLIHMLLERKCHDSIRYFQKEYSNSLVKMLNVVDRSGRVPEFLARDLGLSDIANELKNLAAENKFNVESCIDFKGNSIDTTENCIIYFFRHDMSYSLLTLANRILDNRLISKYFSIFENSKDSETRVIFNDDFAKTIIEAYGVNLSVAS